MARKNPYKDIESQIRERLEFVRDLKAKRNNLRSSDPRDEIIEELRGSLVVLGEAMALTVTKSLLSELPKNYSALHELEQMYGELK